MGTSSSTIDMTAFVDLYDIERVGVLGVEVGAVLDAESVSLL